MQRKRQLEGTLADGRGFEERRREVEAFLARLQARLDRMPPVGQTLDILEAQLKEQKVSSKISLPNLVYRYLCGNIQIKINILRAIGIKHVVREFNK